MIHKKKMLVPLLICSSTLIFTACGHTPEASTDGGKKPAQEGGALTLWMFDTTDYIKPAAEEVAKEMNLKLNYEFINPETYKTKIKVAVAANELPDVFGQYNGRSERELILNSKMAAPLNDVLKSTGLESKYLNGSLIKEADGNVYSMPYRSEQSEVLAYNKKLLAEMGLQPPKTWEELVNVIKAANSKNIVPIALGGKDRWPGDLIYNTLVLREDVDAYAKAQKGEGKFTDKPFEDAAQKIIQLVNEKAFQPGFLGNSDLEAREMFYSGKALMIMNGSWIFAKAIPALGDDLGYIKFPQTGAAKDPFSSNTGDRNNAPYGLFVNVQSKQLQKAKEFAIRYSLKVNDQLVKSGQPSYANTEAKPDKKINEAYAQYLDDYKGYKFIQTYWYDTVPAAVGDEYRDLNQKLYTGTLSAAEFTQKMEQIMKKR
ncbi:extracellular solute-binding protein [Paenibacillus periandrae]|uniref:extracellular solute-binding protein n=1 Tax=Paenibacillus periandrae TaxID=1761741 RepID=UPI001F0991E1|nr:extracellular solute-binding protein [Paenibacillus periandrae]